MFLDHRIGTRLACVLLAGVAAVTVFAAAPSGVLEELDEVVVRAKTIIRLDDFVELPKFDSVVISPGGTRLATGWIDVNNYSRAVSIFEFPSMKPLISHAMSAAYSASNVSWVSDNRLLLQANWPVRGLIRTWEPLGMMRLIDPDGGNPYDINGESMGNSDPLVIQRREAEAVAAATPVTASADSKLAIRNSMGPVQLVTSHTGKPDQILFQTTRANDRSGGTEASGAFLLNLKGNRQTRVATLPVSGGRFVTGPEGKVALAAGVNAANEAVVYYLPEAAREGGRDWQLVARTVSGAGALRPVAWTGTGEEYYALDGRSTPNQVVVVWNPVTNAQRVVFRHPSVDMEGFAVDPSGRPWMFTGTDHFPVYWYPDPQHPLARLHRAVVQKVRDETVEITSASDDMAAAVVRVTSGRRPPIYLPVNTRSASSMAPPLFSYPTLRGTRLSQVDPIEFRARDGLVIRGYLTTPEDGNGKPRTGLPLLIMAHDGPLDGPAGPGYEFERQLFASRGYAVLQINHRGSRGRGAAFARAGDGKWGREVQDDFADGVQWAIKDGVADANRVCFYGIGYGAYSAMVTAAHAPELFRCVIAVGGVYDLPRYLGEGKKPVPAALKQVLGDDMEQLKARSPVHFAAAIKARVLLLPQNKDEYFPAEQSISMRTALKDAGNAPEWETLGVRNDGQHVASTRAAAYSKLFHFLEESLGK